MKIITPYFVIEDVVDGEKILKNLEKAGRTCYKSEEKVTDSSASVFIKKIIESGHETILEHEKITVRIICDRGVTHEIVRHRIVSYSQESTRYCNYGSGKFGREITVIEPCFWEIDKNDKFTEGNWDVLDKKNMEKRRIWNSAMKFVEKSYLKLIELGASPQEARSVLPNSLKTEIVMTANLREWRHFFRLRCSPKAHPQMREITLPMLVEFKRLIPVIFDDIVPE